MAPNTMCECVRPREQPGSMICGYCGLRRIGSDISRAQLEELAGAMAPLVARVSGPTDTPSLVRRYHGRKRLRNAYRL